jgi:ankyrin repeat protein
MKQIFIYQFVFLLLTCFLINGMDKSKQLVPYGWNTLPNDLVLLLQKNADLISSYNLANTCKYYYNILNPNGSLLQNYPDFVTKMNVDIYTKAMICYARSENVYMFFWLKKNTNKENRKETQYIFDHVYGLSCMDKKKSNLSIYKTSEYVEKKIPKFVPYSDKVFPLIRLLIHQGFNINYQWKDGNTLLHFLTYGRNKDRQSAIKFLLLSLGTNVNIQNETGATPLHMAIGKPTYRKEWWQTGRGMEDMQPFLERVDLLINLQDKEGNTVLHSAIIYKNDEQIKCLIQRSDIDFDIQNNEGNAVLHDAKFYEYINLIPNFSANINIKNKEGNTPLHVAATSEQYNYLLLRDDTNINSKNNKGESPLYYSIKHPKISSGSLGSLEVCILTTSWNQAWALLRDNRVDKTSTTKKGKNLLHYAAKYYAAKYNDECDILEELVEKLNVNLEGIDYQGRTALHRASQYHNDKAVEYLLQKMSANTINLYDKYGYSALDYASTTLKSKDKQKWKTSRFKCCLIDRNENNTIKLFLQSDKVHVPFLSPYYRKMIFYGFLAVLGSLSFIVFLNLH